MKVENMLQAFGYMYHNDNVDMHVPSVLDNSAGPRGVDRTWTGQDKSGSSKFLYSREQGSLLTSRNGDDHS